MKGIIKPQTAFAIIKNIPFSSTQLFYVTNTIYIQFFDEQDVKTGYFVINPPWRIIFKEEMIQNSYNYPFHENYTESEKTKEEEDFNAWCTITNFMRYDKVKEIVISETSDLTIEWECGSRLNAFIMDRERYDYSFCHISGKKVYRFKFGECCCEDYEKRKRSAK